MSCWIELYLKILGLDSNLKLPNPLSEEKVIEHIETIASKNKITIIH